MKYFAYGSKMNSKEMDNKCGKENYKVIGKSRLDGYRFEYNGHSNGRHGPAGDIVESDKENVYGVLYEINKQCRPSLDKSEGYKEGRDDSENTYKPIDVTVILSESGEERPAFTYIHIDRCKKEELNCEYVECILAGAKEHNLPPEYISKYLDVECQIKTPN